MPTVINKVNTTSGEKAVIRSLSDIGGVAEMSDPFRFGGPGRVVGGDGKTYFGEKGGKFFCPTYDFLEPHRTIDHPTYWELAYTGQKTLLIQISLVQARYYAAAMYGRDRVIITFNGKRLYTTRPNDPLLPVNAPFTDEPGRVFFPRLFSDGFPDDDRTPYNDPTLLARATLTKMTAFTSTMRPGIYPVNVVGTVLPLRGPSYKLGINRSGNGPPYIVTSFRSGPDTGPRPKTLQQRVLEDATMFNIGMIYQALAVHTLARDATMPKVMTANIMTDPDILDLAGSIPEAYQLINQYGLQECVFRGSSEISDVPFVCGVMGEEVPYLTLSFQGVQIGRRVNRLENGNWYNLTDPFEEDDYDDPTNRTLCGMMLEPRFKPTLTASSKGKSDLVAGKAALFGFGSDVSTPEHGSEPVVFQQLSGENNYDEPNTRESGRDNLDDFVDLFGPGGAEKALNSFGGVENPEKKGRKRGKPVYGDLQKKEADSSKKLAPNAVDPLYVERQRKMMKQFEAITSLDLDNIAERDLSTALQYDSTSMPKEFTAIALHRMVLSADNPDIKGMAQAMLNRFGGSRKGDPNQLFAKLNAYSERLKTLGNYWKVKRPLVTKRDDQDWGYYKGAKHVKGVDWSMQALVSVIMLDKLYTVDGVVENHIKKHIVNRARLFPVIRAPGYPDLDFTNAAKDVFDDYFTTIHSRPVMNLALKWFDLISPAPVINDVNDLKNVWLTMLELKGRPIGEVAKFAKLLPSRMMKIRSLADGPDGPTFEDGAKVVANYKPGSSAVRLDNNILTALLKTHVGLNSVESMAQALNGFMKVADGSYVGCGEVLGQVARLNKVFLAHHANMENLNKYLTEKGLTHEQYERDKFDRYYAWLGMNPRAEPTEWVMKIKDEPPSTWPKVLHSTRIVRLSSLSLSQLLVASKIPGQSEDEEDPLYALPINELGYKTTNWDSSAGFGYGKMTKLEAASIAYKDQDDTMAKLKSGVKPKQILVEKNDYNFIMCKPKTECYSLKHPQDLDMEVNAWVAKNWACQSVRTICANSFTISDKLQMVGSLIDVDCPNSFTPKESDGSIVYPGLNRVLVPLKGMNFTKGNTDLFFRRIQRLAPFKDVLDDVPDRAYFVYSDNVYPTGCISQGTADLLNQTFGFSGADLAEEGQRYFISIDGSKMESSSTTLGCSMLSSYHLGCVGITPANTPELYAFLHDLAIPCASGGVSVLGSVGITMPYSQSGHPDTMPANDAISFNGARIYEEGLDFHSLLDIPALIDAYRKIGVTMTLERAVRLPPLGQIVLGSSDSILDVDLLGYSITAIRQTGGVFDDEPVLIVPILERSRFNKACCFEKYPAQDVAVSGSKSSLKALSLIFSGWYTQPFEFNFLLHAASAFPLTVNLEKGESNLEYFEDIPLIESLSTMTADVRSGIPGALERLRTHLLVKCRKLYDYLGSELTEAETLTGSLVEDPNYYDGRRNIRIANSMVKPLTHAEEAKLATSTTSDQKLLLDTMFMKHKDPFDSVLTTVGVGKMSVVDVDILPSEKAFVDNIVTMFGGGKVVEKRVINALKLYLKKNAGRSTDYGRILADYKGATSAAVAEMRLNSKSGKKAAKGSQSTQLVTTGPLAVKVVGGGTLALMTESTAVTLRDHNSSVVVPASSKLGKLRGDVKRGVLKDMAKHKEQRAENIYVHKVQSTIRSAFCALSSPESDSVNPRSPGYDRPSFLPKRKVLQAEVSVGYSEMFFAMSTFMAGNKSRNRSGSAAFLRELFSAENVMACSALYECPTFNVKTMRDKVSFETPIVKTENGWTVTALPESFAGAISSRCLSAVSKSQNPVLPTELYPIVLRTFNLPPSALMYGASGEGLIMRGGMFDEMPLGSEASGSIPSSKWMALFDPRGIPLITKQILNEAYEEVGYGESISKRVLALTLLKLLQLPTTSYLIRHHCLKAYYRSEGVLYEIEDVQNIVSEQPIVAIDNQELFYAII